MPMGQGGGERHIRRSTVCVWGCDAAVPYPRLLKLHLAVAHLRAIVTEYMDVCPRGSVTVTVGSITRNQPA